MMLATPTNRGGESGHRLLINLRAIHPSVLNSETQPLTLPKPCLASSPRGHVLRCAALCLLWRDIVVRCGRSDGSTVGGVGG